MCTSNPKTNRRIFTRYYKPAQRCLDSYAVARVRVGQRALLDASVVACAGQQRIALHLIPYVVRGFGDYRSGATHDFAVLNKRRGLAALCGRNQVKASEVGRRRPIRLVAREVIESKTCASVWTTVSYEFPPNCGAGRIFNANGFPVDASQVAILIGTGRVYKRGNGGNYRASLT